MISVAIVRSMVISVVIVISIVISVMILISTVITVVIVIEILIIIVTIIILLQKCKCPQNIQHTTVLIRIQVIMHQFAAVI